MKITPRAYGVDVSSYQSTAMNYSGAKFGIVKLNQGTNYVNPNAKAQIANTKAKGMMAMGYFYATFGGSAVRARSEAQIAIRYAKAYGLAQGTYLGVDWESGSENYISGPVSDNTEAIMEAMKVIKNAGYKPLLYSGASAMRNNLNSKLVVKEFGDCLWVASYATMGRIDEPSFNWFPSMDGIIIWQFTVNWHGLDVDGNISLLKLDDGSTESSSTSEGDEWELTLHPVVKWDTPRVFIVSNLAGCNLYSDASLDNVIGHLKRKAAYAVLEEKDGALKLGKNQWVDGRAGVTKSNPLAFKDNLSGRVKVVLPHTHALASPSADADKVYELETNKIYHVSGRKGRFFALKDKYKGKSVWVTGNRAYVVV